MSISPDVAAFMAKYGVRSDEIYLLPGGKKHGILFPAIRRVARENRIVFGEPDKWYAAPDGVILYGKATNAEGHTEWALAGAAPANCQNKYYPEMAVKRLKSRLALTLLGIYGELYGEDEIDESEAGERSPPQEDAIEKAYLHVITCFVHNRKEAEDFYSKNKGMIGQLRVAAKKRVYDLLAIRGGTGETKRSKEEAA